MTKQQQAKQTPDPNASFIKAQAGEIVFVAADGAVLDRATLAACYTAYSCHAELLAALKALAACFDDEGNLREQAQDQLSVALEQSDAAIAKAEGR